MERRTVLGTVGSVFLGLTAGCLGSEESEFMLRVVDEDFGEGENGALTVWVTVSNPGNERQTGTLYVTAEINDESKVRVREVALDAHETTEFEIAFEESYEDITSFSLDSSVEPES